MTASWPNAGRSRRATAGSRTTRSSSRRSPGTGRSGTRTASRSSGRPTTTSAGRRACGAPPRKVAAQAPDTEDWIADRPFYELRHTAISTALHSTLVMTKDGMNLHTLAARVPVRLRQLTARRARLSKAAFRPFSVRAWTSAIVDRGNGCIRWPDRHGPVQRTSGPFPDVPVLVISGDLDPNVPTAKGRQAARQFPHARVVEVPNAWHGPELEPTGCALSITINVIRSQRIGDTSCLSKIPPHPVS